MNISACIKSLYIIYDSTFFTSILLAFALNYALLKVSSPLGDFQKKIDEVNMENIIFR